LAAATAVFVGVAVLLTPAYKALLRATGHATVAKAQPPAQPAADAGRAEAPSTTLFANKKVEAKQVDRLREAAPPVAVARREVAAPQQVPVPVERPTPSPSAVVANKVEVQANADGQGFVSVAGAPAPVAMELRATNETIVVVSADVSRARSDATQLVLALGGHLSTTTDERIDRFQVVLPVSKVEMFRQRLLQPEMEKDRSAVGGSFDFAGALAKSSDGRTDSAATNEPVSVLEIRVVAPAK
jgi:hypothetical protein